MLQKMVEQGIIFYVIGGLTAFGVFAKLVSYFTVRRMVKAAKDIQKSNHKLMRLIKAKFEHASMISDKVQNVEAFVDKYIYEYKVMGIGLSAWRSFPKKVLLLTGVLGVFAVLESYRIAGVSDLLADSVQWTCIFVVLLLLLYFVAEENSRLMAAKNYMVEYLENVCIHRYAKMNQAVQEEEEPAMEIAEANAEENTEEKIQEPQEVEVQAIEKQEEIPEKNEQEMRIRAILEEFLA